MRTVRAFAAAVALHAGGIALLVHAMAPHASERAPTVPPAPIIPALAPQHAEPIDVVFLDEPQHASVASQSDAATDGQRMRVAAAHDGDALAAHANGDAATSHANGDAATAHANGDAPAARAHGDAPTAANRGEVTGSSPLMKMRGPELRLDDLASALEAIAGRGELPTPVPITGRLHTLPGGRAVIHDQVATIDVDPDGTAHLTRQPDFSIHVPALHLRKLLHSMKESVADWYADPYAATRYPGGADTPTMSQGMPACDTWGDICNNMYTAVAPHPAHGEQPGSGDDDGGGGSIGGLGIISGRLDLTSYLARKLAHTDVYSARKLALLDSTRPEREQRGAAFRAEALGRSALLMRDNLARLDGIADPAELHRALFELWDECSEGDGADGQAGDRARGQVIGWIRAHLPAGGANAFTSAEIAALDAHRTSVQHFAPY